MIEIKSVYKTFEENLALSDINLTLKAGEIAALIGENGAGKSTLMRIMCGYLLPSSGQALVCGHDVNRERLKALSYIGYVPELSSLYTEMTVYDFLAWAAGLREIKDVDAAIIKAARQMKITDVLDKKIETLSKGYKKRTEIASALIHEPAFLILDEPTDGLDPNQKHDIRQFMKKYAKDKTVLVSTHVLEDADIADRVIMLSKGKIISDTGILEFKKVSKHKDLGEAFRILSTQAKEQK